MVLTQDFREFVESLNKNNVRFLIVEGYAVAFHGHPRYTKDLDIWIWATPQNARNLVRALTEFGLGALDLVVDDFLEEDRIIQLGYPPHRIDLLTSLPGVDFETCFANRVEQTVDNLTLPFIALEDLKKNKRTSGRLQDLADLENLQ